VTAARRKPRTPPSPQRRKPFQILLDETERGELEAAARRARLPLGTWLRNLGLDAAEKDPRR